MRDAELCKDALVEDRAVAGCSDLLQLSIEGLVKEESVGPWIPVQGNILDQVSTEMTLQAIMDHLHFGIAHVRRCSAHCVDCLPVPPDPSA